jgi:hypothetical protein
MSVLQSRNEFDGNNWISIEFTEVCHVWKRLRNNWSWRREHSNKISYLLVCEVKRSETILFLLQKKKKQTFSLIVSVADLLSGKRTAKFNVHRIKSSLNESTTACILKPNVPVIHFNITPVSSLYRIRFPSLCRNCWSNSCRDFLFHPFELLSLGVANRYWVNFTNNIFIPMHIFHFSINYPLLHSCILMSILFPCSCNLFAFISKIDLVT